MLINSGIKQFIFSSPYPDPLAEEMAAEAGIKMIIHEKKSGKK